MDLIKMTMYLFKKTMDLFKDHVIILENHVFILKPLFLAGGLVKQIPWIWKPWIYFKDHIFTLK